MLHPSNVPLYSVEVKTIGHMMILLAGAEESALPQGVARPCV